MKRCAVCQQTYRSQGTTALIRDGRDVRRARVCGACARNGVLVIASPVAAARCACGAAATTCAGCSNAAEAKDQAKTVAGAARKLRKLAEAYDQDRDGEAASLLKHADVDLDDLRNEGRAEGLRQAADVLDSGSW